MKKNKLLISGLIFFLLAVIVLIFSGVRITMFPTQEVELSNNANFGKMLPGTVFMQEVTMHKDYLERVDLYFGNINNDGFNETVVVLVNEAKQIIYSSRLSSREIVKADYYPFQLKKPEMIGKGKKILVCLSSVDGDPSNCLTIPLNRKSTFGLFSVARIQNNDLMSTIANPRELTRLDGSIGIKTHETNNLTLNFSFYILLVIASAFTIIIIFNRFFKQLLSSFRLFPEYAFILTASVFGIIFLYITPPFQTPDEPAHFYRAYQLSTLNFSRHPDDVPKSVQTITAPSERMKFKSWEKTTKAEILSLREIKLSPEIRVQVETVNYTIPYVPQALGIAMARIFSDSPIWYLYTGRFFNLLVAIGMIFMAIKIIPVHKWIIFMLGVMPMTISQVASTSYDATTIGLSFLLFALILKHAFGEKDTVFNKEILVLFFLTILLAFCKPPYFLICLGFLIIPVQRIGSIRKFTLIFIGLLISGILVSQFWSSALTTVESLFVSNAKAMTIPLQPENLVSTQNHRQDQLPESIQSGNSTKQQNRVSADNQRSNQEKPQSQSPGTSQIQNLPQSQSQPSAESQQISEPVPPPVKPSPFNPEAQMKFIQDNPLQYSGILVNSVLKYMDLYMTSFVGLFGFNDTALPNSIVYLFIITLIVVAIVNSSTRLKIGIARKIILLVIFILCVILIETGLYIYSNVVRTSLIVGVQGRYFIPLAPLFFILFYQQVITKYVEKSGKKPETNKPLKNLGGKTKASREKEPFTQQFSIFQNHYFPWIMISFALFSLTYSVIIILNRFYIITC